MLFGLIIILALLLAGFLLYNSLVGKKNAVEQAFGTIDVMCKKRYDLIPNLVATVKQYAKHEAGTLERVAELRSRAVSGALAPDESIQLNNEITRAIGKIMVAVEAYPQLKASENFMHLQRSLNETEEQLSAARRAFNAAVTNYNNAVEMFPTNLMASLMNYRRRPLFEAAETERQNPRVNALFNE